MKGQNKGVRLYQLAPESRSLMMSYVIITENRKVIVIDGGIDGVGAENKPYLPAAIRAILGLDDNGYFEVEAWFLTHQHRDHYHELGKMLEVYKPEDNYKINNIYFDYPQTGVQWDSVAGEADYDPVRLDRLKAGMDNYYSINGFNGLDNADIPERLYNAVNGSKHYYYNLLNGAVINADAIDRGLVINIDGVSFHVLLTWCEKSTYVNSTSVIMKMDYKGKSVLFLGDCASDESDRLLEKYKPEQMRADIVQLGHHGQGGPDKKFYDAINAKNSVRLWPTPDWVWVNAGVYQIGHTRSWMGHPYEAAEFEAAGLLETGMDIVAGRYKKYPRTDATRVDAWDKDVLEAQLAAFFPSED